jgi:predicted nucleotidyltransferase
MRREARARLTPPPQPSNVGGMSEDKAAVWAIVQELTENLRETLGADLVGLSVYGSFVSGGFDPGVSDLDLIAITATPPEDLDLRAIEAMHAAFVERHPAWADRIEVVYVAREAVRSFRTSSARMAVISPGEPFHLRPEPPIEWVQNWYLVRETGVVLFGEPATSLIPPVEWAEFAAASARYATDLARRDLSRLSPGGLAYTVLTLCRAEETLIGGTRTSKQEAAAIAELRHPESAAVIRDALRCRLAPRNEGFDDGAFRSAAMTFIRDVSRSLADHGDAHRQPG